MILDTLRSAVLAALATAGLPAPDTGVELSAPKSRDHGDWATNVALQVARPVGRNPREVAEELCGVLSADLPEHVTRVEVAGPGFINFHLGPGWLHDVIRTTVAAGAELGRSDELAGDRVNLEFVSANPTGPLHAGGGRWVAVGDALANVLAARGATVHREYYLNDAGGQLDTFAESLLARYEGTELPEDGYQGEYLVEMADTMRAELGGGVTLDEARAWGYEHVVTQLRSDLARIGVEFDTWFSERTLHDRGDVEDVLSELTAAGVTFEADGATWLRSTDFGDQRDRVLVRSDGTPTYLAADFAYHRDKMRRGWDHLIDIWGADHHGQVPSIQAGMQALGAEPGQPEVILGQLVRLERGGETVRLSKRAGDVVTLADILDEVDPDAARLTFLLQSIDTAQTIDLDVVTAQSMENPVYYVQYAHARIASITRHAADAGVTRRPLDEVDLSALVDERELDLLRAVFAFDDAVADAAEHRAPYKITNWVRDLAGRFHRFYAECRVVTDDAALTQARLWLAETVQIALAAGLDLLGVSAPEQMDRLDTEAS